MNQIVEHSVEFHPPQKRPKPVYKEQNKIREFKVVGDEPPRMFKKMNMSYCPIWHKSSKTDVQVIIIIITIIKLVC